MRYNPPVSDSEARRKNQKERRIAEYYLAQHRCIKKWMETFPPKEGSLAEYVRRRLEADRLFYRCYGPPPDYN